MEKSDIRQALDGVDEVVHAHAQEVERLKESFAYRMERLKEERRGEMLNRLLSDRLDRAIQSVSEARSVHDAYSRMLASLLKSSRNKIASLMNTSENAGPAATTTISDFAQLYALVGYAETAKMRMLATMTLREIFDAGKLAAAMPRLKAVVKVGGDVAADEALKYSGADSAQNMAKVVKVLRDSRAAMNVSERSKADVSSWLDQLDAAEDSLQDWLHVVQGDIERIEQNFTAIVDHSAPDV